MHPFDEETASKELKLAINRQYKDDAAAQQVEGRLDGTLEERRAQFAAHTLHRLRNHVVLMGSLLDTLNTSSSSTARNLQRINFTLWIIVVLLGVSLWRHW